MPSQAFVHFRQNILDVDKLIESHRLLNNGNPGKKGLGHITRSGIVILCATWELYIESLLNESLTLLLSRKNHPNELPTIAKKTLARLVKEDKHDLKPIELAGDGWRNTFSVYAQRETDLLNSPKSEKIDTLYKRYLGIVNLSSSWVTPPTDLDTFVGKRGAIAHQGRQANYIKIGELIAYRKIIYNLVTEVDQQVLDYLISLDPGLNQPWRRTY
jgi:hypothetical protein